jgi:hypothetical protein
MHLGFQQHKKAFVDSFLLNVHRKASCVPEGLAPKPEEVLIPLRFQISADQPVS